MNGYCLSDRLIAICSW